MHAFHTNVDAFRRNFMHAFHTNVDAFRRNLKLMRAHSLVTMVTSVAIFSASTLKEISFWKEFFAKWRKFKGNKFWRKCEGNSRRIKEIWRKKQNFAKIGNI
jgi:hypothetical protein